VSPRADTSEEIRKPITRPARQRKIHKVLILIFFRYDSFFLSIYFLFFLLQVVTTAIIGEGRWVLLGNGWRWWLKGS